MRSFLLGTLVLLLLAVPTVGAAQSPSPSKEDKEMVQTLDAHPEKLVALIQVMQSDPYGEKAQALAAIVVRYIMESEKVSIQIGALVTPLAQEPHDDQATRLLSQFIGGLTLYALQHGGKAGFDDASDLAGLDAMLGAYTLMLQQKSAQHNAYCDKLLALKKDGKLQQFVAEARSKK